MGHNTLGVIPGTKSWRVVVDLLDSAAATEDVIAASAKAAEKDLLRAADDPVFVEAVRLLLSIPNAARSEDFGQSLRSIGLQIPDRPDLLDMVGAVSQRLDDIARHSPTRTDLGELAARALASALTDVIGSAVPALFGATPEDVQATTRKFSWTKGIAELSRNFFGTLVGQALSYWLDRALAGHVGDGRRFANGAQRHAFDAELDAYTAETSRIIKEFSGGWYGKTLHTRGEFGSREAAEFGAVCLKKTVQELRRRREKDA